MTTSHPPLRRRTPRRRPRRRADRVRRPGLRGHVDRGHREAGRDLAALPLPPLRHEEGALHRLRHPLLPRHARALPAGGRGHAGRRGAARDRAPPTWSSSRRTASGCGRRCRAMRRARTRRSARSSARASATSSPTPPRLRRRRPESLAVLRHGHAPERPRVDAGHRRSRALDDRSSSPAAARKSRPPFFSRRRK